jgi:hypothetical protein
VRTITEKRKEFMKTLTETLDIMDPTGVNSQNYIDKFKAMDDKEFDRYIRKFFNDDSKNFYFEIEEYERDLKYDNIEKAAKYLGVPLYERVALPYINHDLENIVVSPEPVPVGYIHEKRMMQTLFKKNAGSINIRKRNPKTGQVTSEDKNARNSDVETYSLLAIGAEAALKEFLGPRADDLHSKDQMYSRIGKDGYVTLRFNNGARKQGIFNYSRLLFLNDGIQN